MSNKRPKRGSYLSKSEAEMLISLIIKYSNELQDEKIDAASLRRKEEIWKKITDEFNANSSQFRSVSQVKGKYKNIKRTLKKNGYLRERKNRETFDIVNLYDDRHDDDDDEFEYNPNIYKSFVWNNYDYDSPRTSTGRSLDMADNTVDEENVTDPSKFLDHSAFNPLVEGHPKARGSSFRRRLPNNEDALKREDDGEREEDVDREDDVDRGADMQREEETSNRGELFILEKRILEKKLENLEIEREQSATEHLLRVELLKIQIKSFKEKTFPSETD